jgi:hypothetical protein
MSNPTRHDPADDPKGQGRLMRQRYVFLHYHLFKNGGSTIDWILERTFGDGFDTLHDVTSRGVVSNAEIIQFLLHHPNVQALSSHHFQVPFPRNEALRFIEICFLRHPMDRLQSMYYYYKRIDDSHEPNALKAKEMGIGEWLGWMMETAPFNVANAQTSFFGRILTDAYPSGRVHLERAKDVIGDVKFLGIVERFDESLVAAEHFLRVIFPTLDLSYVTQNARQERDGGIEARLEQMRAACGAGVYGEMRGHNELDEELWEWTNQELDRRLAYIPRRHAKVDDFRARCAAHSFATAH